METVAGKNVEKSANLFYHTITIVYHCISVISLIFGHNSPVPSFAGNYGYLFLRPF